MKLHASLIAAVLAALTASCTRSIDPCPEGMFMSHRLGRCIEQQDAHAPHVHDAAAQDAKAPAPDGSHAPGDAALDASQPSAPDGSMPGGGGNDASVTDASDTNSDASTACSAADTQAWQAFHLSDGLVDNIVKCVDSDPSCAAGLCPLDTCLRNAAGVQGCHACIAAEVSCVAQFCVSACGSASDDAHCRACACGHHCVETFNACAGSTLDVCADCDGTTCAEMSVLPPELIMVVVGGLLR